MIKQPLPPAVHPGRAGMPNRNIILRGRPHVGKTTFGAGLVLDPSDPRWRWMAHFDADESASSIADAFADPSVARHFPLDLDEQQWRDEILSIKPAVAAGECGAMLVEGVAPLYVYYAGKAFGENPAEVEKGGNHTRLLYAKPAAKIRSVYQAILEVYQAAPKDSGFVCIVTMHMKNVGEVGKAEIWEPRVSEGVWGEMFTMTPVVIELSRTGSSPPYIEWEDPTNEQRRIKNALARDALDKKRVAGTVPTKLAGFLDVIRGAEQWQRNAAKVREAAEAKKRLEAQAAKVQAAKPAPIPAAPAEAPQPAAAPAE